MYSVRNSSGRQTSFAPSPAASFTRRTALSRLARGSATMLICTRATVNFASAGARLAMRRTLQPIHPLRNVRATRTARSLDVGLRRADSRLLVAAQYHGFGRWGPRCHLPEELAVVRPMPQHSQGAQTACLLAVAPEQRCQLTRIFPSGHGDLDQLEVAAGGEHAALVQHVRDAVRHSCAEVPTHRAEHDDDAPSHVFTAMIAYSLDHRVGA